MAANNAEVYDVGSKCEFMAADVLKLEPLVPNTHAPSYVFLRQNGVDDGEM